MVSTSPPGDGLSLEVKADGQAERLRARPCTPWQDRGRRWVLFELSVREGC